jgi:molybdate transport system substrate-binding protein
MTETTLAIFTAGATREGIAGLAPAFRTASGIALDVATAHGHLILERALAGDTDADVVMLPSSMVDALVQAGRAVAATRTRIGAIRIGAAVRSGVVPPDVSTVPALLRALMGAGSVVITEAPSGRHMDRLFAELGLAAELEPRITRYDTGTMVNEHLIRSDTPDEIAFGGATEILFFRNDGVAYVGPLPDAVQMAAVYEAAMLTRSDRAEAARRLMDFLRTDTARRAFAETGVETDA